MHIAWTKKCDEECGKAIRGRVAHPEDEIQHEDHVLHARADIREVAAPAIIHHRVAARAQRISQMISALETDRVLGTVRVICLLVSCVVSTHGDEVQPGTHTSTASTRSAITTFPNVSRHDIPAFLRSNLRSAVCPFRVPRRCVRSVL